MMPLAQFDGLSMMQMNALLNIPFEGPSPVKFRVIDEDTFMEVPILRQALHLMRILEKGDLKQTAVGYIPPKIVEDIYNLGAPEKFLDYYKTLNEGRVNIVRMLKEGLKQAGLIKVRYNKLSLTAKGRKGLKSLNLIFTSLTTSLFTTFNMACFDGYSNQETGNLGRAFSLWLLNKYGDTMRDGDFYYWKYYDALTSEVDELPSAYTCRVFDRLFVNFGIIEIRDIWHRESFSQEYKVKKTALIDKLFSFDIPAFH